MKSVVGNITENRKEGEMFKKLMAAVMAAALAQFAVGCATCEESKEAKPAHDCKMGKGHDCKMDKSGKGHDCRMGKDAKGGHDCKMSKGGKGHDCKMGKDGKGHDCKMEKKPAAPVPAPASVPVQ